MQLSLRRNEKRKMPATAMTLNTNRGKGRTPKEDDDDSVDDEESNHEDSDFIENTDSSKEDSEEEDGKDGKDDDPDDGGHQVDQHSSGGGDDEGSCRPCDNDGGEWEMDTTDKCPLTSPGGTDMDLDGAPCNSEDETKTKTIVINYIAFHGLVILHPGTTVEGIGYKSAEQASGDRGIYFRILPSYKHNDTLIGRAHLALRPCQGVRLSQCSVQLLHTSHKLGSLLPEHRVIIFIRADPAGKQPRYPGFEIDDFLD
ncbi:hypothetical protein BKA70DRAFT_1466411 [Coprinopsis sp. MPI-PUGE-AT-0042]|nr:hypothetical protein BKA70DRAFT_1466411 [Coprinopsis sp. MPI-PUGE-AT-0042]